MIKNVTAELEKPGQDRIKELIRSLPKSKIINFLSLLVLITAIPLTVFIAQQQQDLRQRAQTTPVTPATPPNPTSPTPALLNNLLANPGFENGSTGWQNVSGSGSTIVTDQYNSGTRSLRMIESSKSASLSVLQIVPVTQEQSYFISAWVRTQNADGRITTTVDNQTITLEGGVVTVEWLNISGQRISANRLNNITGTKPWAQYSNSFLAPTGARGARIRLNTVRDPANSGYVWYDDLVFSQTHSQIQLTPTTKSYNRVFLTKTTFTGNLGGLAGADQICQTAANGANLGGTWKAWLSSSTVPASQRLTKSTLPYKLLNGTVVANNWTDLTDGTLLNQINMTETKELLTTGQNGVWTNTDSGGNIPTSNNASCSDWTSSQSWALGRIGSKDQKDFGWTLLNYPPLSCINNTLRLYCFEQ